MERNVNWVLERTETERRSKARIMFPRNREALKVKDPSCPRGVSSD